MRQVWVPQEKNFQFFSLSRDVLRHLRWDQISSFIRETGHSRRVEVLYSGEELGNWVWQKGSFRLSHRVPTHQHLRIKQHRKSRNVSSWLCHGFSQLISQLTFFSQIPALWTYFLTTDPFDFSSLLGNSNQSILVVKYAIHSYVLSILLHLIPKCKSTKSRSSDQDQNFDIDIWFINKY